LEDLPTKDSGDAPEKFYERVDYLKRDIQKRISEQFQSKDYHAACLSAIRLKYILKVNTNNLDKLLIYN
jgi:hypothetical protein